MSRIPSLGRKVVFHFFSSCFACWVFAAELNLSLVPPTAMSSARLVAILVLLGTTCTEPSCLVRTALVPLPLGPGLDGSAEFSGLKLPRPLLAGGAPDAPETFCIPVVAVRQTLQIWFLEGGHMPRF